jgi:hypothetical protein
MEVEMEAEVAETAEAAPVVSKSYSSRIVEFLRTLAITEPDATFTSEIYRHIGLKSAGLVSPILTRLAREGIIRKVGKTRSPGQIRHNQIMYQFVDPTINVGVRSLSRKGLSRNFTHRNHDLQTKLPFIDGENPEPNQPMIDTLKEAILQADTRDHKSAIKESEMSLPLCREESLVEMLLRFGIAVERYQSNPDLSRVSAEALMQEVKRRGLV